MNPLTSLIRVAVIPLFTDNYSYVVQAAQDKASSCFLIDPADTNKILQFLNTFPSLKVSHILYTHKHLDHIGDPKDLLQQLKEAHKLTENYQVVSSALDGKQIVTLTTPLFLNQTNNISEKIKSYDPIDLEAIYVPCHTTGHVLYRFKGKDNQPPHLQEEQENGYRFFIVEECLFTGDTLFIGGCGRFFEGNAQQMVDNMDTISSLSNKMIKIFCGHEYSKANYDWSSQIEKENQNLIKKHKEVTEKTAKGIPTVPSTLQEELETNVFIRVKEQSLLQLFDTNDPILVMESLRAMKNANITEIPTL